MLTGAKQRFGVCCGGGVSVHPKQCFSGAELPVRAARCSLVRVCFCPHHNGKRCGMHGELAGRAAPPPASSWVRTHTWAFIPPTSVCAGSELSRNGVCIRTARCSGGFLSPPQGSAWGGSTELLVLSAWQPSCRAHGPGEHTPWQSHGGGGGELSADGPFVCAVPGKSFPLTGGLWRRAALCREVGERLISDLLLFIQRALYPSCRSVLQCCCSPPSFFFFLPFCYQHLLSGLPFLKKRPLARSEAPVVRPSVHQEAFQPRLAPIEADSKQSSPNARGLCTDLG